MACVLDVETFVTSHSEEEALVVCALCGGGGAVRRRGEQVPLSI